MSQLHAYWTSYSPHVSTLLQLYVSLALVTLHEWPLLPAGKSEQVILIITESSTEMVTTYFLHFGI